MEDTFGQAVSNAIGISGKEILKDKKRLVGYLSDLAPECKKEVRIFSQSCSPEILQMFYSADGGNEALRQQTVSKARYMLREEGLSEEWANKMVNAVAYALGWKLNSKGAFEPSENIMQCIYGPAPVDTLFDRLEEEEPAPQEEKPIQQEQKKRPLQPQPQLPPHPQPAPSPTSPKKKSKKGLVAVLAVCAIGCIVAGAWFLGQGSHEEDWADPDPVAYVPSPSPSLSTEEDDFDISEEENNIVETPSPSPRTDYSGISGEMGNTSGNINNRGLAVEKDGLVYYADVKDRCLNVTDGERAWVLAEDNARDLNMLGDWLYYCADGAIYRIRTDGDWVYYYANGVNRIRIDGASKELIAEGRNYSNMIVTEDWIYCLGNIENGEGTYLLRISMQNGSVEALAASHDTGFALDGDWVYYYSSVPFDRGEPSGLYKIRTDGTERILLTTDDVSGIQIVNGWVYYNHDVHTSLYDNYLCRIRTDGSEKEEVQNLYGDLVIINFNIADGWVYSAGYIKFGKPFEIWRARMDGTDVECMVKNDGFYPNIVGEWFYCSYPNIVGEWLYFTIYNGQEGFLCRKPLEGGEVELMLVK